MATIEEFKSIMIDNEKFSKTSKKLFKALKETNLEDLNLSKTQEILAESLGFRNLYELKKELNEKFIKKEKKRTLFLNELTSSEILRLISVLIEDGFGNNMDMWKGRAISLVSTITMVLVYMRDKKELVLDVNQIREYLNLENILKLYKTREDFPPHIKATLKSYLVSLPGCQIGAPKQNDVTFEQHGYLQMQIVPILNKLELIENNNIVLTKIQWIQDVVNDKINFVEELQNMNMFEKSWLNMKEYKDWLLFLNKKQKFQSIKILDLALEVINTIDPIQVKDKLLILNSILNNFVLAEKMSKIFTEKIN